MSFQILASGCLVSCWVCKYYTLIKECECVKEAASAGAKMLCFPENFSYVGAAVGDSLKIAEPLDGPIMKGYCSLAR